MGGAGPPERDVYEPAEDTALVISALRVTRGERVLEIGTGRGEIALTLARRGARVTATDINPAAAAIAAARAQSEGVALEVLVGDMYAPDRKSVV